MELRNSLQLRISYQLYLLKTLPWGYIGTYRNQPAVFLTKDPNDPSVNSKNKKRYLLTREKGKLYSELVNKSQAANVEYERLMAEWKRMYKGNPTIVEFPLDNRLITGLSSEQFKIALPNQNTKENRNPIEYKGQLLRSKNELLGIQEIEKMGFDWKTEININGCLFPDATFDVPYIGKSIMAEIDGMMEDFDYCRKSVKRQFQYHVNGFREFSDVVFYRLSDRANFDIPSFRRLIELSIELNATFIMENQPSVPQTVPQFCSNRT